MQLADALPLGFTSECEMADIWLRKEVEVLALEKNLEKVLPDGIELRRVSEVALSEPALQNQTLEAEYQVTPVEQMNIRNIQEQVEILLLQPKIPRERKGKTYDLRPRILALNVLDDYPKGIRIAMRLSLSPANVGRPDEVLRALDLDPLAAKIHRTKIVLADEVAA
jgi:radical SAM-linked protein